MLAKRDMDISCLNQFFHNPLIINRDCFRRDGWFSNTFYFPYQKYGFRGLSLLKRDSHLKNLVVKNVYLIVYEKSLNKKRLGLLIKACLTSEKLFFRVVVIHFKNGHKRFLRYLNRPNGLHAFFTFFLFF